MAAHLNHVRYHNTLSRCSTSKSFSSLPSPLSLERQVNPFLRCEIPEVRAAAAAHAGHALERPEEVFGTLRAWKDQFR